MGKNYAESSLKHYLKQKVRITLGLVVAFLITGAFAFAEGTAEKPVEEMNDFEIAKESLTGISKGNILTDKTISSIEGERGIGVKSADKNTTITLTNFGGKNPTTVINSNDLSDITKEYLNTALDTIEKNKDKVYTTTLTNMDNDGIVASGIVATDTTQGIVTNTGIIYARVGQRVKNGTVVNKGIIIASDTAGFGSQYVQNSKSMGSEIYNYGILAGNGQAILGNSSSSYLDNRGLILNGTQKIFSGDKNIGKNYGVIDNTTKGSIGQIIDVDTVSVNKDYLSTNNAEFYNYGIIKAKDVGQKINVSANNVGATVNTSKLINYGLIQNEAKGQSITAGTGNTAENYGIIESKDYAIETVDENTGINYGVVIKTDGNNKNIFSDNVENKGLVILATNNNDISNSDFKLGNNKGVVVNADYSLAKGQENTVAENKIEAGKATFTSNGMEIKDSDLSDKGALENKNLIAVIDGKNGTDNKTAFKYTGDKELFLKDVEMLGYFVNDANGNVLELDGKDLAIGGNTKIVALNNGIGNVNAVELNGGSLTVSGNAQIVGNVSGQSGTMSFIGIKNTEGITGEIGTVLLRNSNGLFLTEEENYTNATFDNVKIENLNLEFTNGNKDIINTIVIKENAFVENFDAEKSKYDIDMTVENINNIADEIVLGQGNDKLTVTNDTKYSKVIDGNLGDDTLVINPYIPEIPEGEEDVQLEISKNIFNFKVNNIENIALNGDWHIGENAEITFKDNNGSSKAVNANPVNLNVSGKLTAEMNNNKGNGDFTTSLDKITSGNDMTVTAKGGIKYEMGENFAINSDSFTTNSKFELGQYDVESEENETTKDIVKEDTKLSASGIFEVSQNEDNSVTLRVKSADELGIGSYAPVYEAILAGVGSNQALTDRLNKLETSKGIANLVKSTKNTAKAYYTAGNVVTKNIVDTYLSSVTEFKDRADKGEWIAYGKYINSDTEFDGGSEVKGYDGDITGTVGMIEYGMTDSTSYGAVFGKGDTKVDINDGGELSGDNYYGGVYFKHRTAEGIDVLGSFGIVKSDLDSKLKNSFEVPEVGTADALVDGTADSKAVSAVLKAKKDYYVAEGLKVQPVVGAALTLITQEEAENKKMGLTISQQDVDVYELITGVNVIKEFALESGNLEIGAGVEYSWANSNQDRDAKYMLNGRELTLEDSEIASSRGKVQIGAEYIHENGIGVDTKYEMLWSDKGDDSRITAGVSYRF